jgi:hypothetical protein
VPWVPVVEICNWVAVNLRLGEYGHEQVKIRKERWNNKEIKKFDWKWISKQEDKKPGVIPCNECLLLGRLKYWYIWMSYSYSFFIAKTNSSIFMLWLIIRWNIAELALNNNHSLTQYIKLVEGGALFYIHVII